ncbi:MAG: nucleotidyltransferase domain-containing protein [Candidatus Thorarchaeota archaeon]|nr:nucleotidyltransferase domain-containing protein [Candidatus Thorarchaeota archaeon]
MTKRPKVLHELRTVHYGPSHWNTLAELRKRALRVMEDLETIGLRPVVHGSVARGDVSSSSDIDIVILSLVPSYRVELAVGSGIRRELVQATPSSVLKGHIHVDDRTVISFPLFRMMSRELDFYKWGGVLDSEGIRKEERVPGVDKRLLLIQPTVTGHTESGVIGYEHLVAKRIGVGVGIAEERVRVLTRRDAVGRTGVYLTHTLTEDENFEETANALADRDPALRRTMKRRG